MYRTAVWAWAWRWGCEAGTRQLRAPPPRDAEGAGSCRYKIGRAGISAFTGVSLRRVRCSEGYVK